MTPFLSIIIPIYKIKEEYLRACFESLLTQDCSDFQIIAVDDGSPDHSGEICDEYASKDSRIIVIHQKNAGVYQSVNLLSKSFHLHLFFQIFPLQNFVIIIQTTSSFLLQHAQ